jgi:crossover junction endodeoxyribonuclease RuvC
LSRFSKPAAATTHARQLRRDSTDVEKKLWQRLRSAQALGVSFRKQHPIGGYIVDFCAPSVKLVIELDGGQHADALAADRKRTAFLERQGFSVIRFWNNEVAANIDGVLQAILNAIAKQKTTPPQPSPFRGGRKKSKREAA